MSAVDVSRLLVTRVQRAHPSRGRSWPTPARAYRWRSWPAVVPAAWRASMEWCPPGHRRRRWPAPGGPRLAALTGRGA